MCWCLNFTCKAHVNACFGIRHSIRIFHSWTEPETLPKISPKYEVTKHHFAPVQWGRCGFPRKEYSLCSINSELKWTITCFHHIWLLERRVARMARVQSVGHDRHTIHERVVCSRCARPLFTPYSKRPLYIWNVCMCSYVWLGEVWVDSTGVNVRTLIVHTLDAFKLAYLVSKSGSTWRIFFPAQRRTYRVYWTWDTIRLAVVAYTPQMIAGMVKTVRSRIWFRNIDFIWSYICFIEISFDRL